MPRPPMLFEIEPMPCTREEGLRIKDEKLAFEKENRECFKRLYYPGYETLKKTTYYGRGEGE